MKKKIFCLYTILISATSSSLKTQDFYSLLGVNRNATKNTIKRAIITLKQKREITAETTNAWKILTNDRYRQQYDIYLKNNSPEKAKKLIDIFIESEKKETQREEKENIENKWKNTKEEARKYILQGDKKGEPFQAEQTYLQALEILNSEPWNTVEVYEAGDLVSMIYFNIVKHYYNKKDYITALEKQEIYIKQAAIFFNKLLKKLRESEIQYKKLQQTRGKQALELAQQEKKRLEKLQLSQKKFNKNFNKLKHLDIQFLAKRQEEQQRKEKENLKKEEENDSSNNQLLKTLSNLQDILGTLANSIRPI